MQAEPAGWGKQSELPEDEEYSPFDADSQDQPVLFLRLVDAGLRPWRHLAVEIAGASGRHALVTDGEGVVFIDGCEPGRYVVSAALPDGPHTAAAHTLFFSDLAAEADPYLLIL